MQARWIWLLLILLSANLVLAQDAQTDLVIVSTEIETGLDAFGLETTVAVGEIRNDGVVAYNNISVFAEAYDASGELIGEGFGYKVDACGVALLDFALQPGDSGRYEAALELFESDIEIDRVDIIVDGEATDPAPLNLLAVFTGLTTVTRSEVVQVEWIDGDNLRYGVGCDQDLFLELDWSQYDITAGISSPIEHPAAGRVTEDMIREAGINILTQGGEEDTSLFPHSYLSYHPYGRRAIYQTDLNTLITIEPDGTFRRLLHDELYQYSLQGFIWLPEGRFLAYYFGAYGEDVRYLTANVDGQLLGARLQNNQPSVTVPGPTESGTSVVIGGMFDGTTGYWMNSLLTGELTLLFEVDELPGNNYPAPVYYTKDDLNRFIYVIRPIAGNTSLQCFARDENELYTLTAVPLDLDIDARSWAAISPDANRLAIYANGESSGLWLIDLNAFDVCR